jgi:hypothetical protein
MATKQKKIKIKPLMKSNMRGERRTKQICSCYLQAEDINM